MKKTVRHHADENDFDALDRLARSLTLDNTRPLNARERQIWEQSRRGRPKKPAGKKAVPTLITVEPKLLKKIDAYVKKKGMSRSQLFAESVKARLRHAG